MLGSKHFFSGVTYCKPGSKECTLLVHQLASRSYLFKIDGTIPKGTIKKRQVKDQEGCRKKACFSTTIVLFGILIQVLLLFIPFAF